MPDTEPQPTPSKLTCPLCGGENACKHGLPEPCWCTGRPVSKEALESALGPFDMHKTCLCKNCLTQFETGSAQE